MAWKYRRAAAMARCASASSQRPQLYSLGCCAQLLPAQAMPQLAAAAAMSDSMLWCQGLVIDPFREQQLMACCSCFGRKFSGGVLVWQPRD